MCGLVLCVVILINRNASLIVRSYYPLNPIYANFNIMHLAFNCEIKMAAHGRSSAYYVFVLLDPFPQANDEDV